MKVVHSQYDKNDTSTKKLSEENEVLAKKIIAAKEKVEIMKKALADSKKETGENSSTTKTWQTNLNKAQAELNTLTRKLESNKEAISSAEKATEEETSEIKKFSKELTSSSDKVSIFGDVLKANLASEAIKKGISLTVDGIKKIGSAAFSAAKESIESYADYEQLVGGVDKLFKDSADKVKTNASKAYKAAGLNANEYMENVTSFSASLISSLDGNTKKAVDYADMAIVDMADNANVYGTEIKSIQNAYQGFAKQNYTMLDNLKLGYGGTKTEMERLIADANKLKKANGEAANLTIDSYADVVEAIHTVQTEMGITGTTSKEASITISGSVDSMKSAYHNLLTGLSDENADVDSLVDNFVESIVGDGSGNGGVINTVGPRIKTVISGIGKLASAAIKESPQVINLGSEVIGEILDGISNSNINYDVTLNEVTKSISSAITSNGPKLAEVGVNLFSSIVGDTLTLTATVVDALPEITDGFVEGLTDQDNIDKMVDGGIELAGSVVENTPKIVSKLILGVPKIIDGLFNSFTSDDSKGEMEDAGTELGGSLLKGILLVIPNTIMSLLTGGEYDLGEYTYARTDFENAKEAYNVYSSTGSTNGLVESQKKTIEEYIAWANSNDKGENYLSFMQFLSEVKNFEFFAGKYAEVAQEVSDSGIQISDEQAKVLARQKELDEEFGTSSEILNDILKEQISNQEKSKDKRLEIQKKLASGMTDSNMKMLFDIDVKTSEEYKKQASNAKTAAENTVGGYNEGLKNSQWLLYDNVKNTFGNVIDWVKELFGIRSPSKVFGEIADYNIQGFVNNTRKGQSKIRDIVRQTSNIAVQEASILSDYGKSSFSLSGSGYNSSAPMSVSVSFPNANISSNADIEVIANRAGEIIADKIYRKSGAFS